MRGIIYSLDFIHASMKLLSEEVVPKNPEYWTDPKGLPYQVEGSSIPSSSAGMDQGAPRSAADRDATEGSTDTPRGAT